MDTTTTLDLTAVGDALNAQGIAARIEHTGGGVYCLLAGPTHEDANGDKWHAVIAGPAWYGEDGRFYADTADCYAGPEDNALDVEHEDVTTTDVAAVAALIAAQVTA